ncbi:MAG: adenylosuccinate lyase [Dehalococcoidia bacterium]
MIERYSRPEMKYIWSDENKFAKWLEVEIAACEAWSEIGVIPAEDIHRLKKATCNLDRMNEILVITHHDVTAFLKAVSESLSEEARWIHLGMTSSDVIDTATSLQLQEASTLLQKGLDELTSVIRQKAGEHKHTIMMGRTHGVHAEPITFGLKMALWYEELKRHQERLAEAKRIISTGKISGAVGSHATVPPEVEEIACRKLGLEVAKVSSQIIQRDRHAQFITTLALIASSMEKFATEIRGLQRTEILEAEEPFEEGQTGSSAMPHKRNPELCERVCGLARLIRGHALTSMENIALWHERDISHSSNERIILPDPCLALDYTLSIFTYVMRDLNIYPENMRRNLGVTRGLTFSQRVLTVLIEEKGLSREDAYKVVQRNAMQCWKEGGQFFDLLLADPDMPIPRQELEGLFDYDFYLKHIDAIFARLGI